MPPSPIRIPVSYFPNLIACPNHVARIVAFEEILGERCSTQVLSEVRSIWLGLCTQPALLCRDELLLCLCDCLIFYLGDDLIGTQTGCVIIWVTGDDEFVGLG